MTKYYDEFVKLKQNSKLSVADVMRVAGEQRLFEQMTKEDINTLHKEGYIHGTVASWAIKALQRRESPVTV